MSEISDTPSRYKMNVDQIQKLLPHRAPFLMIDRILEIHPNGSLEDRSPANMIGTRVIGLKNASFNEPHFQGHFPGFAIMPGVLMIEAMAQTASFSIYPYIEKDLERFVRDFQCILVGVDGVRFRKPVTPGDSIRIESKVAKCRGRLWSFECFCTVDGQKVSEAEILANIGSESVFS
jgi:3-hydroxyacyl-[acyl-carrier-protein] dehydratase